MSVGSHILCNIYRIACSGPSSIPRTLIFQQQPSYSIKSVCACACAYVWVGIYEYACAYTQTNIYVYTHPLYKCTLPFWVYEYISVNAHYLYLYIYE